MGRDKEIGVATRYRQYDSGFEIRWGQRFSVLHTRPERASVSPSPLYNGYGSSFSGVKQAGLGTYQPPPSSAEVQNE